MRFHFHYGNNIIIMLPILLNFVKLQKNNIRHILYRACIQKTYLTLLVRGLKAANNILLTIIIFSLKY